MDGRRCLNKRASDLARLEPNLPLYLRCECLDKECTKIICINQSDYAKLEYSESIVLPDHASHFPVIIKHPAYWIVLVDETNKENYHTAS
jgi:hypothetical protein